jgi:glycosyltransferase involved in cell wall biosynthesis
MRGQPRNNPTVRLFLALPHSGSRVIHDQRTSLIEVMPMSLPKILFYTHGLVDGGAERLWACLASAFKYRGYDVIFAQDFEAQENRANLDASVPLTTLGANHFRAVRRLAQLLRDEKPDVALSAVGGSNLKLLAAIALARTKTRPILSYHGAREYTTGWLSYGAYLGLPIWSRWAPRTIAVSEGLRQQLRRRWHANDSRTVTILNPVFYPENAGVPTTDALRQREDIVLSVGRFVPEKDYQTLVRAFARLDRPNARLVILGKGPQFELIRNEIRKLGLEDRVDLPGYSNEPWHAYATAKCFVSSSSSEPFGNVVVEAMAHGLPVVATACAGPKEILRQGEFGRLVPIGDDVQLAAAIEATLAAPGDPEVNRRRAQDFSFKVRVPAYEAVIREVLAEASGPVRAASVAARRAP